MSEISKRAAYLKGLADGMELDKETNEGKLLDGILDLLVQVTDELDAIDEEQGFIADKIDEMEDVIELIGEDVYGEDYDDDDEFYTLVCEKCGAEIDLTGDDLDDIADGKFKCPKCGEVMELDFEGCDDEDCGCGCHHEK